MGELGTLQLYDNGKLTHEATTAFQDAKDDFLMALRSFDTNDSEMTEKFTALAESIAAIEKTLEDDDLKFFKKGTLGLTKSIKRVLKDKDREAYKSCTSAAYELSRIISEDPKLESLRKFKLAVKEVANYSDIHATISPDMLI